MSKLFSQVTFQTLSLYIFVAVTQFVGGLYLASESEPPGAFTLLYVIGFLWIMGWWLLTDSRKRGVKWAMDMGLFLYIAWPLIMPYYLLKTRGAKGLLIILGFAAVYLGALNAGAVLYMLLNP
ncbi:MAG TPA: hypothetical protein VJS44_15060 [Pyrinomonadaceae bacterium]|nr:hypothetical protein [Pyrinomonadaceae bacterium]